MVARSMATAVAAHRIHIPHMTYDICFAPDMLKYVFGAIKLFSRELLEQSAPSRQLATRHASVRVHQSVRTCTCCTWSHMCTCLSLLSAQA